MALGAPQEIIDQVKQSDEPDTFEIFEECWEPFVMFTRLSTQWLRSEGAVIGLNYTSVEFLFNIYQVANRREMLEDIQVMELAAMNVLNNRG